MENKHVLKIDLVLIVGSLFVLMLVVGYSRPLVISPIDELETSESSVLFSIEKAEEILIDDNVDFSSPDKYKIRDGLEISLSPGVYYWKASGVLSSGLRTLTVNSVIDLRLVEGEELFEVVNAGNVHLNVDIFNGSEKIESVSVGVGEGIVGEDGNKYVGGRAPESVSSGEGNE